VKQGPRAGGLALQDFPLPAAEPTKPGGGLPYNVYQRALEDLERKGFRFELAAPSDPLLALPADLGGLGPAAVQEAFDNALRHWDFVANVEADIEARLLPLKGNMEYLAALCKEKGRDPELDKEYIECKTAYTRLGVQRALLKPKKTLLHRRMAGISRSVEGMKMGLQHSTRGESLSRAPRREPFAGDLGNL